MRVGLKPKTRKGEIRNEEVIKDLVKGSAGAEDEIDGALNEAVVEIVKTLVIVQCVLIPVEAAIVKCCFRP